MAALARVKGELHHLPIVYEHVSASAARPDRLTIYGDFAGRELNRQDVVVCSVPQVGQKSQRQVTVVRNGV